MSNNDNNINKSKLIQELLKTDKINFEKLSEAELKRNLVVTRPNPSTEPPTDRSSDTSTDSTNSGDTKK